MKLVLEMVSLFFWFVFLKRKIYCFMVIELLVYFEESGLENFICDVLQSDWLIQTYRRL